MRIDVSTYRVDNGSIDDRDSITIEWRNTGKWAICDGRSCYSKKSGWQYEPMPSNRSDEFKAETRFSLEEAMALAIEAYARRPWLVNNPLCKGDESVS